MNNVTYSVLFILLAGTILLPASAEDTARLEDLLRNAERELDWQFFEQAERSYGEIRNRFPQQAGAGEALGYICLMQQKYKESFLHLEMELEREPDNDLARLLLGIVRLQTGDYAAAREMVDKFVTSQSSVQKKVFGGNRNKRSFFKKFMGDNPGLVPFVLGILYKEQGKWQLAEKMMADAADKKYSLSEILVQLVDQYLRRQDVAAAAGALSKLEAENFLMARQLSDIVKSQDRQEAMDFSRSRPIIVRYCREPIATIVDDLNMTAQNAVKRADPESAIKTWKKALLLDDRSFVLHYNMALIYCLYGFLPESLFHCLRAVDLGDSRHQPWALNLAGNIHFEMGHFEMARSYYLRALHLAPDSLKCRNNLGAAYWKLGDLKNAEHEWRSVIRDAGKGEKEQDTRELEERETIQVFVDVKERGEIIEASQSLVALYLQQERSDEAIPLLMRVLQFVPSDAEAHFELGRICMQKGDFALARRHLDAALRNGTKFESEASNLLAELERKPR
jgi:tetratricopeptide (TPR) repeat protein